MRKNGLITGSNTLFFANNSLKINALP